MSMYHMLHGVNPLSKTLIEEVLNLTLDDFERFRDVRVTDKHIQVYTRCGGANREAHQEMYTNMKNHSLYSHDEDCSYDETYSSIYFNIPEEYKEQLSKILYTPNFDERHKQVLKSLGESI